MANIQQLELQRQKLIELSKFLTDFEWEMKQSIVVDYRKRADDLLAEGLTEETYLKLHQHHIYETYGLIEKTMAYIEYETIPFIRQNIEIIERLIAANR